MPLPIVYHEAYEIDIGPHVFPTRKYRLVRQRLVTAGAVEDRQLIRTEPADDRAIERVHTAEYVRKIRTAGFTAGELLRLEVPFSAELRDASWLCAGGSTRTARLALDHGVALHLGGGFHHAFPDHGEGFCLINDVAVAVETLREEGAIRRALVVDCDVHHGNGTAAVFAREPAVFTFSMHQEANYPAWKPPSDLDLGLADGTGDEAYLALLDAHLPAIVDHHRPELAFYLAGADPYEHDQLGGLSLTLPGLLRRDELVIGALRAGGAAVAVVLAGGYATRPEDTVEIHCNTARAAAAAA